MKHFNLYKAQHIYIYKSFGWSFEYESKAGNAAIFIVIPYSLMVFKELSLSELDDTS